MMFLSPGIRYSSAKGFDIPEHILDNSREGERKVAVVSVCIDD